MAVTFSEQGKRKILEGLLAMEDSPFWETIDGGLLAKYDELRIGRTHEGGISVALVWHGKEVLSMPFPMPEAGRVISLISNGNMETTIEAG